MQCKHFQFIEVLVGPSGISSSYKGILNVRGLGSRWSGNSSGLQEDLKDTGCHEPGTTELVSTEKIGKQATADSRRVCRKAIMYS